MVCWIKNRRARGVVEGSAILYGITLEDNMFLGYLEKKLEEKYKSNVHQEVEKRFVEEIEKKTEGVADWLALVILSYKEHNKKPDQEKIFKLDEYRRWEKERR